MHKLALSRDSGGGGKGTGLACGRGAGKGRESIPNSPIPDIFLIDFNDAPLGKFKIRPSFKKGLSVQTKELMNTREKIRKQASKCTNPLRKNVLNEKYHKTRNLAKSRIRKEDKRGVISKIEESQNPSEYWKNVKEFDSYGGAEQITLKEKTGFFICPSCEEKPFNCSQCERNFESETDLLEHERIHTEEKPYSCSQCDVNFESATDLSVHERIHSRGKPYSCSQCDGIFKSETDLSVHVRIHTGGNPYSC